MTALSIFLFAFGVIGGLYIAATSAARINRWRLAGNSRGLASVFCWTGVALGVFLYWNVLLAVVILVNRGG